MKRSLVFLTVLVSTIVAIPVVSFAEIVSTSGAVVEITPPPSVRPDQLESDTQIFAFEEQQSVTLASAVSVDITQPGTYDDSSDLTPGTIPAGTTVSSHFLHADAPGPCVDPTLEGTVVFDADIIGIIVTPSNLNSSDHLGAPGTEYPTWDRRAMELDTQDDFIIEQIDRRTVVIHVQIDAPNTCREFDQVRIITEDGGEQIGAEGCTPGFWKQTQHFAKWTGYSPSDSFEAVFGRDAFAGSPTLLQALNFGAGGLQALARHSVAGLLNATNPDVDYAFTSAQVIAKFQAAFDSGNAAMIEATKNEFNTANNAFCEL